MDTNSNFPLFNSTKALPDVALQGLNQMNFDKNNRSPKMFFNAI